MAYAQQNRNGKATAAAPCSVAHSGSNDTITIKNCGVGEAQGKQILEILRKMVITRIDPTLVMKKLDEALINSGKCEQSAIKNDGILIGANAEGNTFYCNPLAPTQFSILHRGVSGNVGIIHVGSDGTVVSGSDFAANPWDLLLLEVQKNPGLNDLGADIARFERDIDRDLARTPDPQRSLCRNQLFEVEKQITENVNNEGATVAKFRTSPSPCMSPAL